MSENAEKSGGNAEEPARKKRKIFLDAVLEKQIGTVTFRGKLHQFSAFLPKNRQNEETSPQPGMTVRVALSPFDMSKGAIESWTACPTG